MEPTSLPEPPPPPPYGTVIPPTLPAAATAATATRQRRHAHVTLRPGHVTSGWATVFWVGWLLVAGGFAAVWYSSRVTGLSTWWLGPESAPRPWFFVPFVAPIALAVMALKITRRLPWWGVGGAAFTAVIAAFDVADVPKYAAVEFALAAAGLMLSVAAFAGMLRAARPDATPDPEPGTGTPSE